MRPEHMQKLVSALDARNAEQHSQAMEYATQRMFAAMPAPQHGLK